VERDERDAAREAEAKRQEAEAHVREFRAEVEATREHGVEERAAAAEAVEQDRAESDKEAEAELGGES